MTNPIIISDLRHEKTGPTDRLSANMDGTELFFESNDRQFDPGNAGDALLCAAMVPAMKQGRPIVVEGIPVSKGIVAGLKEAQLATNFSWPDFTPVTIDAPTQPDVLPGTGVGSFFTGGADSSFTFANHRDEISELVFVRGIDIQITNLDLLSQVETQLRSVCERLGKKLTVINSNVRHYITSHGFSWNTANGAGLASIAHTLGFDSMLVPSSYTYADHFPSGSNAMINHLFSNRRTVMRYDGAAFKRVQKLEKIAEDPILLSILRVCWQDSGYNCGECEKCVRTMLTLELLGAQTDTFPQLNDDQVKALQVYSENELSYLDENLELAKSSGNHAMAAILGRKRNVWRLKKLLRPAYHRVRGLLGGQNKPATT